MVTNGASSHHAQAAGPVAANHPSQRLEQQTFSGVTQHADAQDTHNSMSATAVVLSAVTLTADQTHPPEWNTASAAVTRPTFRSDPAKPAIQCAQVTHNPPVRRITNWHRATPSTTVATDNLAEAPTDNVSESAASGAAKTTTEPPVKLVSETACSPAATENTNNCLDGTVRLPTQQQKKEHPPSAPVAAGTTKPPLPPASHQPPTSNRKGGIIGVFQSAVRGDRKQTTTNNTKFMSPISMCFDRMLGAGTCTMKCSPQKCLEHSKVLTFIFSSTNAAAAIKTPSGAKSTFSKTPAAMETKKSESENGLTKESKRMPFLSKRKIHPVDVETVRSRSLSMGNLDPFKELAQDSDLERLVILEMAKQRQTVGFNSLLKDSPHERDGDDEGEDDPKRPISRLIFEGFYWKDYPACELVLYNHMTEYYEISAIKKDYKVQQEFNNILVEEVREAAIEAGFEVDPNFDDKKLRDRIRCFFKTHLQNAKKRLATLQKHSDAPENRALVSVFIRMVRNPSLTYEDSLAISSNGKGHDISGRGRKRRRLLQQQQQHKTPMSAAQMSTPLDQRLYHGEEDEESVMPAQPQWSAS